MHILANQSSLRRISVPHRTLWLLLACFSTFASAVTVDVGTGGCGGTYSGSYGNFTSPGYPNKYADNLRCLWTIKVSENSRIHIDFIYIEIETGDGCLYDYLLFRDGLETTSPALAKICHAHTTTIKSTGSAVTVLFATDSSTGLRGFHLVWKAVPKMPLLQPEGMSISSPWMGIATPKNLRQMDGGITEHLWAVDRTSTVYLYANRIWDAVEDKMAHVTSGPIVIGTSEEGFVWYRKGITSEIPKGEMWERVPITIRMQRVESGQNRVAVGLDLQGNLHQLQIINNKLTGIAWKILDGDRNDPLIDLSCGSYACWFVTLKGIVFLTRDIEADPQVGGSLETIRLGQVASPFLVKQVAAGYGGSLWAISSNGDAYKRAGINILQPEGTSWQKVERASFEQITVNLMGVYGLTKSGIIITMEEPRCGGVLTAKKGMFASPDYPNVYPANMTCLWIIRVPHAEGILVQFMKLVAVGRTSVCHDDHLVSYENGRYSARAEPVVECGDKVEDKYFAGNEVWIEFKSGTINRGFGFQAVYDAWFDNSPASQGPVLDTTKKPSKAVTIPQTQMPLQTRSQTNEKTSTPSSEQTSTFQTDGQTTSQMRTQTTSQADTQTFGRRSTLAVPETSSQAQMQTSETTSIPFMAEASSQAPTQTQGETTTQKRTQASTPAPTQTHGETTTQERAQASTQAPMQTHGETTTQERTQASTQAPTQTQGGTTTQKKTQASTQAPTQTQGETTTQKRATTQANSQADTQRYETSSTRMITKASSRTGKQTYGIKRTLPVFETSPKPQTRDGERTTSQMSTKTSPEANTQTSEENITQMKVQDSPQMNTQTLGRINTLPVTQTSSQTQPRRNEKATTQTRTQTHAKTTNQMKTQTTPQTSYVKTELYSLSTDADLKEETRATKRHESSLTTTVPSAQVTTDSKDDDLQRPSTKQSMSFKATSHTQRVSASSPSEMPSTTSKMSGSVVQTSAEDSTPGSVIPSTAEDTTQSPVIPSTAEDTTQGPVVPSTAEDTTQGPVIPSTAEDTTQGPVIPSTAKDTTMQAAFTKPPGSSKGSEAPHSSSSTGSSLVSDVTTESSGTIGVTERPSTLRPESTQEAIDMLVTSARTEAVSMLDLVTVSTQPPATLPQIVTKERPVGTETSNVTPKNCYTKCATDFTPICGSDGKTYANECAMKIESCITKKVIKIVTYERCETEDMTCEVVCGVEYEPVCGTDSKTYANECLMRVESCITKQNVEIAYRYQCKDNAVKFSETTPAARSTKGPTTVSSTKVPEATQPTTPPSTADLMTETTSSPETKEPSTSVAPPSTSASTTVMSTKASAEPSTRSDLTTERVSKPQTKEFPSSAASSSTTASTTIESTKARETLSPSTPPPSMPLSTNDPAKGVVSSKAPEAPQPTYVPTTAPSSKAPEIIQSTATQAIADEMTASSSQASKARTFKAIPTTSDPMTEAVSYAEESSPSIAPPTITRPNTATEAPPARTSPARNNPKPASPSVPTESSSYEPTAAPGEERVSTKSPQYTTPAAPKTESPSTADTLGSWERISVVPRMRQVSSNSNDTVWALSFLGFPYLLKNGAWKYMGPERFISLFVDEWGVWGIRVDGTLRYRQGVTNAHPEGLTWVTVDGKDIRKVVTGPMGNILAIDKDYRLYVRSGITPYLPIGTSWRDTGKRARDLSFSNFGVWIINDVGKLQFTDLKIGDVPDYITLQWRDVITGVKNISAGHGGSLWGILTNNSVVQRQGVNSSSPVGTRWNVLARHATSVSPGHLYVYMTSSDGTVLKMQDNKCGGVLSSMRGVFKSPKYPMSYPKNSNCLWLIRLPGGKGIKVEFDGFELEESRFCSADHVRIIVPGAQMFPAHCGKGYSPKHISSTTVMVEFVSDGKIEAKGFIAKYTTLYRMTGRTTQTVMTTMPTINAKGKSSSPGLQKVIAEGHILIQKDRKCGGLLEESSGIFATPNYPNLYPNDVVCLWVLRVPRAKSLMVTLERFDVGQNDGDFLAYSTGGIDPTNKKPVFVTGPGQFTFDGDTVLFEFVSDGQKTFRGFFARYDADLKNGHQATTERPLSKPTTASFSGCGSILHQDSGIVTSPRYPENYDNNLSCSWVIRSKSGGRVSLTFSDVDVEYDIFCSYDSIKIGDGPIVGQNIRDTFCSQKNGLNFVSQGDHLWIQLSSDGNSGGRGFKASWSVVMETTTMPTTTQTTTTRQTGANQWEPLPPGGHKLNQIEAGISDKIAAVDSSGVPYIYVNRVWIPILGQDVKYITTGDAGMWAISKDGRALFRAGVEPSYPSGTKWEVLGSDVFIQIDSGPSGFVFAIRDNGAATYRAGISKQLPFGSHWVNIGGRFKSLSVGTYGLWGVDNYNNVLYAQRPSELGKFPVTWTNLVGLQLAQIDAGFGNNVWGISGSGSVLQRLAVSENNRLGSMWELQNVPLSDVRIGLRGIYGIDVGGRILARQDSPRLCGDIVTSRSGIILSPGYPFTSYAIHSHCLWIIRVPGASKITLTVASFDIYETDGCTEDYLFLYKRGHFSPEYGGEKYCGRKIDRSFTYNGNEVWIQFNAGNRPAAIKPRGFDIRYSSEVSQATTKPSTTVSTPPAPTTNPVPSSTLHNSDCGGYLRSNYGSISSPGFPGQYSANLRCVWTIEADRAHEITLKFDRFNVEEDYACRFDFLLVKVSDNGGRELGKFCGSRLPADIEVGGNKVWILFKTDDTLFNIGFRLNWATKQKSGVVVAPTTRTPTTRQEGMVTTKKTIPEPATAPQIPPGWSKVLTDVQMAHVDGGISPTAWAVDEQGRTYVEDGFNWRLVGLEQMKWVTSGESGVWAVDKFGTIFLRRGVAPLAPQGAFWDRVDGPTMEKVDSGPAGSLLALDAFGNLHLRQGLTPENPKGSNWKQVGSGYKHLSVGSYGYWAVDPLNRVFFAPLSKSGQITENLRWIPISQLFEQVKAGFGGELWGVTPSGDVYRRKGVTSIIPSGVSWEKEENLKVNGITAGMSGVFASLQGTNELIKKSGQQCGSIFTSTFGVFSTPNYPSNYPANTVCLWQIRVPGAKRVIIEFTDFRLEPQSSNCNKDFLLYLRDGEFPSAYGAKKRCGSEKSPITFEGDKAWVEFISDDSSNYPGFFARYTAVMDPGSITDQPLTLPGTTAPASTAPTIYTGCGGLIDATSRRSGEFAHSGYPANYESSQMCEYIIRTGSNRKLLLDFDLFDLEYTVDCRYDYLEIRDGELPTDDIIGKYCGKANVKGVRSKGSSLHIRFKSDLTGQYKGYRARWRVEYPLTTTRKPVMTTGGSLEGPNVAEIVKVCGSTVDASSKSTGYLSHPSYPDKYKNAFRCSYTIKTTPNQRIRLTFLKFSLEPHATCRFDYVEVRDGANSQARSVGKFCGPSKPRDILSSGSSLFFTFSTDTEINDDGFLVKWNVEMNDDLQTRMPTTTRSDQGPITECGGVFRSNNGLFATPNYPGNYDSDLDCRWSIVVDETKVVHLSFEFFDIEKSSGKCLYDYVEILDKDIKRNSYVSLGTYCDVMPKETVSSGNVLQVVFHSDRVTNKKGFVARWVAEDRVKPTTPSVVTTEKPCFQRLSGFSGEISRGSLSSFYSPNQDCSWVIAVRNSSRIKIEFDFFEVENSPSCSKDVFKVHDGSSTLAPVLASLCGSSKPTSVLSNGNEVLLRFRTDASNNARGFKLRWSETLPTTSPPTIIPSSASNVFQAPTCGGRLYGSSGVIESPKFNRRYPFPITCTWILEVGPLSKIELRPVSANFFGSECSSSRLLFRDGVSSNSRPLKRLCKGEQLSQFTTDGNTLYVELRIDEGKEADFRVTWQERAVQTLKAFRCGGMRTQPSGVIKSPEYPSRYASNLVCTWVIIAPKGQKISLDVIAFELEGDARCSKDYLAIRSGQTTNGGLLGRYCGRNIPSNIVSRGNSIWLQLQTDCKTTNGGGFMLRWKFVSSGLTTSEPPPRTVMPSTAAPMTREGPTTELNSIAPTTSQPTTPPNSVSSSGGLITGRNGVIQSPNYPRTYPSNQGIVWVIKGPAAGRIALTFKSFSLEEDSSCRYDYVHLRDGPASDSPSIGKFCGNNLPDTYTSADNALWVKFMSDSTENRLGFQAEWKWLPSGAPLPTPGTGTVPSSACGGNLFDDVGEFSTPKYPSRYPPNTECVWVIKPRSKSSSIELKFRSFNLEAETRCGYDFVEVKEGDSRFSPSLGRFCGSSLPQALVSRRGAFWIRFKSDSSTNDQGFLASWKTNHIRGRRSPRLRSLH